MSKQQTSLPVRGAEKRATSRPTPSAEQAPADRLAPDTERRSRYIPALDGIRTLAVIAVVLYHLNLTWAQGGFLGVTIFFVLSGYLITRLLLAEFEQTDRIDLKRPCARNDHARCRRCRSVHDLQPRDAHQDAARYPAVAFLLQ